MRAAKTIVAVLAALVLLLTAIGAVSSTKTVTRTVVSSKVQTIYVRNLSSYVSNAEVARDIPAFQTATSRDFAPIWKVDAHLVFIGRRQAPRGSIVFTLLDRSDVRGALAYHGVRDGVPFASIFVGTSKYYGYSWTTGFTHEEFEELADPNIVSVSTGAQSSQLWAQEVSDPCEADSQGYRVNGVLISDFVTPNWFGAEVKGGFDFLNHIQASGEVLPGGYAQYWDGQGWVLVTNFRKGGFGSRGEHYD